MCAFSAVADPFCPTRILQIAILLADAVSAAHQKGITDRNLTLA
jgi:hypothetical protein